MIEPAKGKRTAMSQSRTEPDVTDEMVEEGMRVLAQHHFDFVDVYDDVMVAKTKVFRDLFIAMWNASPKAHCEQQGTADENP
jgi:hypothetical protein